MNEQFFFLLLLCISFSFWFFFHFCCYCCSLTNICILNVIVVVVVIIIHCCVECSLFSIFFWNIQREKKFIACSNIYNEWKKKGKIFPAMKWNKNVPESKRLLLLRVFFISFFSGFLRYIHSVCIHIYICVCVCSQSIFFRIQGMMIDIWIGSLDIWWW